MQHVTFWVRIMSPCRGTSGTWKRSAGGPPAWISLRALINKYVYVRKNFTGYQTIENRGELLLPPLQLLIIIDGKSSRQFWSGPVLINIPGKKIRSLRDFCNKNVFPLLNNSRIVSAGKRPLDIGLLQGLNLYCRISFTDWRKRAFSPSLNTVAEERTYIPEVNQKPILIVKRLITIRYGIDVRNLKFASLSPFATGREYLSIFLSPFSFSRTYTKIETISISCFWLFWLV